MMKADRERLIAVNHWYDRLSQEWRFHFVVWPLMFIGMLNMLMTLSLRFPFGLLLIMGIVATAAVRVPYVLGLLGPRPAVPADRNNAPPIVIRADGWIGSLNRRYEKLPELQRFWVIPVILLLAGAINMLLTFHGLFPFGLLFLIVVLTLMTIRFPYVWGWVQEDEPRVRHHRAPPQLTHQPLAARDADTRRADEPDA